MRLFRVEHEAHPEDVAADEREACILGEEAYRRKELTRAHESTLQGVSPGDAPSAPEVRAARSVCRRALLAFKVHSQEPARKHQLDQIFADIETISDQAEVASVRAVSAMVTERLEAAVVEYSELRQARLGK